MPNGKESSSKPTTRKSIGITSNSVRWLIPVFIIAITLVAFLPVLNNGFVNWDDDRNILENPYYRGLGWTNLKWMFTTRLSGHYQPLSWITLGLDYLLWGMEPFGYHLTNLLLHAANAVLFYFLAHRLLRVAFSSPAPSGEFSLRLAATFAALAFSIHPLRVESVAWITERRDVLSGLFLFLTLLCYLRAVAVEEVRGKLWMIAAVTSYALSLLAKSIGMTLPVVLLILDVYPLRRLGGPKEKWFGRHARQIWLEKVPFLILALCIGVITVDAQRGVIAPLDQHGILNRIAEGLFGLAFYLWKTVLPLSLSPLYERPTCVDVWSWPYLLSGTVVLIISVGLFALRRYWPAGLASWIYYSVVAAPVLGIVQKLPQIAADRYTYLSCLAWATLAGAAYFHVWQAWDRGRIHRHIFIPIQGSAVVVLVGLGFLTWQQTKAWHDSETLWRHVLTINQQSVFGHNNLANVLAQNERLEEAMEHYREALRIDPSFTPAHSNLGNLLARQDKLTEANNHFRQALEIDPNLVGAHYSLGNVLTRQGELEKAMDHYREALRLDPNFTSAHYRLGYILQKQGKLAEAKNHFRQAILQMRKDASVRSRTVARGHTGRC